eukprot:TRINITY_DN25505_c0_g1_i1.p1 TRINITY_DN25505_c0_g1~~TRINITY_DN25505_c0_g1_i1.p1  ORF type:complete len:115 (-),score=12.63 TRINITY_DN25505_c0_g1_i1:151-495(-)
MNCLAALVFFLPFILNISLADVPGRQPLNEVADERGLPTYEDGREQTFKLNTGVVKRHPFILQEKDMSNAPYKQLSSFRQYPSDKRIYSPLCTPPGRSCSQAPQTWLWEPSLQL